MATGVNIEDYNKLLLDLAEERERSKSLQTMLEREKNDHHFTTLLVEDEMAKVKMGIEVIRRQQEEAKEWKARLTELDTLKEQKTQLEQQLWSVTQQHQELRFWSWR